MADPVFNTYGDSSDDPRTYCMATYDDYDGTCQLALGHEGPHSEGMLEWDDALSGRLSQDARLGEDRG